MSQNDEIICGGPVTTQEEICQWLSGCDAGCKPSRERAQEGPTLGRYPVRAGLGVELFSGALDGAEFSSTRLLADYVRDASWICNYSAFVRFVAPDTTSVQEVGNLMPSGIRALVRP
jgi:hypothetical protein